ncbi:MAG: acyl-CoA dehydrogenase domain protein [Actinomycetia bacterium]|nr:acyl-CoA dehydrogenase domain protein [Actinomycetes bacterium]
MDFDLSDDQIALRDGACELLDDLASPARVRAHTTTGEAYDGALWRAMTEQGWLGVDAQERHGGLGLGTVEVAVLLEELGRHCAPAPFLTNVLAANAFAAAGDDATVERLVGGDAIACVGWVRDGRTFAVEEHGGRVALHGRVGPVVYAPSADIAVIVGTDAVYAVNLDALGRPAREPAMDLTRELGWLHFDNTDATKLGGADVRDAVLDRGASYVAAEMLGGASRALDMTVEYAKDRVQFGRPIGSFQAIKHRCADMLVDVEGMRSTVYWAAWCIGATDPDASVAASTAKVWGSDASKRVMASALQVHGGIGFTWEHDLHFFLKRAQLDQLSFGDASYHRARLTSLLRPRVEAGQSIV